MSEHAGYIESAGESTLSELVGAVWRRRWIVLTVMAASLGAAALITARMPRLYEARAVLRIVPAVVAMSPTQRMASPTGPVVESAESQAALMRTAAFHQAVRQYLTEGLRARRADAAGTSHDAGATMVAGGTQPAGMTVSSRTVFARSDPGVDELQSGGAAPGLRNAVLSFLALSWQTSLEIGAQPDTNVVYVTVRADNAQIARLSANAVAYSLDYFRAMQARERRARITREFASAAAGAIHEVNRLERRERQLREQSGIVDVSAETTALVTQLSTRQAEVATIENDVAAMRARARALAQRLASANASLRTGPGVRDPQLVLSLQKMLSDKEIERAAAAQKYTEEYPGILPDLDEQVRDLRNRLNQAVEAVSDNARPSLETHAQLDMEHRQARVQLVYTEARLAEARRAVARTRVALDRIPSKALAFARVQRELEVARQVAQAAQRAEAEARLVAVDAADSGVYVSADMGGTNRIPVSPNTARNLVLAGLVGAIISLGCVVLLEQGNRCLRAPRDLARLAGGPLVGQLPWLSLWELAAVRRAEEPPRALDAYNLAAARLSLILRDEAGDPQADKRCILITSAVAGEGKSLTAASLARSMARAGQIVALVDADLRRPAQNRLFGTAVPHGLADVIASAMSLDEAIVTTSVPGLSILHSGAAHHAPTELLSSPRVSEVIQRLQTTADTVIIDAPACAVFADALLLARHADCIIQVVALGRVDADLVRNTMDVLRVAVDQRVYVFANYAPRDRSAACTPHFHRQADPPSSRNGGGRRGALPAPSGSEPA